MGKRRKRMTMARYAKKYAKKREALGFSATTVQAALIEIDANGQEEKQEEQVQVVVNEPVVEKEIGTPPWEVEPELELIQVEEPEIKEEVPPPPKKKTTRRRKSTTTKTTTRKTPTRRRSTKKTTEE